MLHFVFVHACSPKPSTGEEREVEKGSRPEAINSILSKNGPVKKKG